MLAERIITRVAADLNDTAYTRWSKDELIAYLNDGQRSVVNIRPDSTSRLRLWALDADSKQSIPSDGRRYLRVMRLMGDAGATPGRALPPLDLAKIEDANPTWPTDTAVAAPKHCIAEPADPRHFYVWPPALTNGGAFGPILPNPNILPAAEGRGVAWSPNGRYLAIAHDAAPYVTVYDMLDPLAPRKMPDPATPPTGDGRGVAWSPAGDYIAAAHLTSPYVTVWPWTEAGFGTKVANPAALPTGDGRGVAWSPAGDYIAVAHFTAPYVTVWPWSGGAFGAKFANPAVTPTGDANGVAWNPRGNVLSVAHVTSPYLTSWSFEDGGFGTKLADPATPPTGIGNGVAWSPTGGHVAIAHTTSPYVSVYPYNAATVAYGAKLGDPATLPNSNGYSCAWSPSGAFLAVGMHHPPFMYVYPFSGTISDRITPAAVQIGARGRGVAWSPDGRMLASATNDVPHLHVHLFGRAQFCELLYSREPIDVPTSTDAPAYSATTSYISLPDEYAPALQEYMMYRALAKEGEEQEVARATAHYQAFMTGLGAKIESETAEEADTRRTA